MKYLWVICCLGLFFLIPVVFSNKQHPLDWPHFFTDPLVVNLIQPEILWSYLKKQQPEDGSFEALGVLAKTTECSQAKIDPIAVKNIVHTERRLIESTDIPNLCVLDLIQTNHGFSIPDPRPDKPPLLFDRDLNPLFSLSPYERASFLHQYTFTSLFCKHLQWHQYKYHTYHHLRTQGSIYNILLPNDLDLSDISEARQVQKNTNLFSPLFRQNIDTSLFMKCSNRSEISHKIENLEMLSNDSFLAKRLPFLRFYNDFKNITTTHISDPILRQALIDYWAVDGVFHAVEGVGPHSMNPKHFVESTRVDRDVMCTDTIRRLLRWPELPNGTLQERARRAKLPIGFQNALKVMGQQYSEEYFQSTHM